jgi:DNA-binding transcriptional regulator YhcF (GntR family)
MDVHVTLEGRGDLTARIYRQLFDAVLDGRLRPGERLPPTRELARRLEVSRNTVALAYERLVAEGVLTSRVGAGTFVSTEPVGSTRARHAPAGSAAQARSVWKTIQEPPLARAYAPHYDFRVGSPDATMFPFTVWRRLVARQFRPDTLDWLKPIRGNGRVARRDELLLERDHSGHYNRCVSRGCRRENEGDCCSERHLQELGKVSAHTVPPSMLTGASNIICVGGVSIISGP